MSAQTQLAELNVAMAEHFGSSMQKAALFLRDHGPAIAELIEAVASHAKDHCSWTEVMDAIRKLTQEATT